MWSLGGIYINLCVFGETITTDFDFVYNFIPSYDVAAAAAAPRLAYWRCRKLCGATVMLQIILQHTAKGSRPHQELRHEGAMKIATWRRLSLLTVSVAIGQNRVNDWNIL